MASIHAGSACPGNEPEGIARDGWRVRPQGNAVTFVLPGLGAGGAERVVNIIANELAARGWRASVVTFAEADERSYYDYAPAVRLVRLGLSPRRQIHVIGAGFAAMRVARLRRALGDLAPDLVISFLTRTNVLTLLAATGTGIPVIVSERNNPKLQHCGHVWSWLRSRLYRQAYGLVTMTQGAMDCFPLPMRRREWVIPNPAMPVAMTAHQEGPTRQIVAVGRLVRQKGFDLLLDAFARIAPDHSDWNLVIWGEGPERAALTGQALRLGVAHRVRMPGVSQIPGGWAAEGDLFVMSSRYEGWGNALLEALGAGIPAIAFDCPWGPREMIRDGENGMLVASEDVAALAEAMGALMHEPALRARLGEAGRRSAARFATADIVTAWEAMIGEAVAARAGRSRAGARPLTF